MEIVTSTQKHLENESNVRLMSMKDGESQAQCENINTCIYSIASRAYFMVHYSRY